MASETTSANASVTGTDVNPEGMTVGSLLTGGERMVLITVGFAIYPTDPGFIGHSCDGIAFPRGCLLRHRPLFVLPKVCVEAYDPELPAVSEDGLISFDLSGFSAAFDGVSGMSRVVDFESTRPGHFPYPVDRHTLDFNLVPDTQTFLQGLTLSRQWRNSKALLASFTFLPGGIGGCPDGATNKFVSKWGFTDDEKAKIRRKTDVTVHVSDALPSRTIELRKVGTPELAGSIRLKPFGAFNLVVGLLTNGWVDEHGDYAKADEVTVNLSHVQAMLEFCDRVPGQSVQVDFGQKTPAAAPRAEFIKAAADGFIEPDLIQAFARAFQRAAILYNSDVNCSGRRMEMSS